MQVAQVLLTLPYSFSQLGMMSGIMFQLFYGLMGSWTAYLISILYIEYRTRKEREKVDFRNHVIQVPNLISPSLSLSPSLHSQPCINDKRAFANANVSQIKDNNANPFLLWFSVSVYYSYICSLYMVIIYLVFAVVWSSWWAAWQALEERGFGV